MSVNEDIADVLVGRDIDLLRVAAGERRRILRLLKLLEQDLLKQVDQLTPTTKPTVRAKRLKALQKRVTKILQTYYRQMKATSRQTLKQVSQLEQEFVRQTVKQSIGVDLATVSLSPEHVTALVKDAAVIGVPASEWWGRQAASLRKRYLDQVRLGLLANETIQDIRKRIRGTRDAGFRNGVMNIARREADALIRTSVIAVSNATRLESYKVNQDVIRGVQALVTLDERTSDICIARSGGAWNLETGDPLDESPVRESFPGHPPWHFNCRTGLVPVLRNIESIKRRKGQRVNKRLRQLPKKTQASIDGQVSADLTFEDWLKRQSPSRQARVLGPGRLKLWQDGKISLRQLIDQQGRPLTIKQLQSLSS